MVMRSKKTSHFTSLALRMRRMERGSMKKPQNTIFPSHNGADSTFIIHIADPMVKSRHTASARNLDNFLSSCVMASCETFTGYGL